MNCYACDFDLWLEWTFVNSVAECVNCGCPYHVSETVHDEIMGHESPLKPNGLLCILSELNATRKENKLPRMTKPEYDILVYRNK